MSKQVIQETKEGITTIHSYNPQGQLDGQTTLYQDQQLIQIMHYKEGKLEGSYQQYENGQLILLRRYVADMLNGTEYIFDKNGMPSIKTNYQADKKHGMEVMYQHGQVMEAVMYKEDQKHGPYYKFYPDGSLLEKGTYEQGALTDIVETYDQQHNLIQSLFYDQDMLISQE